MIFFKRHKLKSLTAKAKLFQKNRLLNQPKDEMVEKEIKIYKRLSTIYHTLVGHEDYPFAQDMVKETIRAATSLNDPKASLQLAELLLEEAKFRERIEKEGLFASSVNKRLAYQLYEEAHAYLKAAQEVGDFQAKRLQGICYIRGWGVSVDRKQGFDLILANIDEENSWDRVPEIFGAIAKDDPELFSALIKYRSH